MHIILYLYNYKHVACKLIILNLLVRGGSDFLLLILVMQPSSNVDAVSNGQLSALLIAAHEGYSTIVELLVGHGADLKTTNDDNGNTALHLINVRKNMKPITAEMKHLWKVFVETSYFTHKLKTYCKLIHIFGNLQSGWYFTASIMFQGCNQQVLSFKILYFWYVLCALNDCFCEWIVVRKHYSQYISCAIIMHICVCETQNQICKTLLLTQKS